MHNVIITTDTMQLVVALTAKQFADLHDDLTTYYNDHYQEIADAQEIADKQDI